MGKITNENMPNIYIYIYIYIMVAACRVIGFHVFCWSRVGKTVFPVQGFCSMPCRPCPHFSRVNRVVSVLDYIAQRVGSVGQNSNNTTYCRVIKPRSKPPCLKHRFNRVNLFPGSTSKLGCGTLSTASRWRPTRLNSSLQARHHPGKMFCAK